VREPLDPRFRSGPPASPPAAPPPIPAALADLLAGATWEQTWVKAESEVWRVGRPAGPAYLKIIDDAGEFAGELARLRWLADRSPIPTPEVLGDAVDDQRRGWLVTAEVPGIPSHDPTLLVPDARPLVEAVGAGLRRFHDVLDPGSCPFSYRVDALVTSAEARVAQGGVDPSTMASTTYRRSSPERLLEHLVATRPDTPAEDLVVAHGDPCQPNLLIDPTAPAGERLCGLVDVGRVGVSDRYRDLAIAIRSLLMNLDPEVVPWFLDAYGLRDPDPQRLEWYVLVDDMW